MADYRVPFPRPRSLETMASREVFDLMNRIKSDIYGQTNLRAAAE
jgi:NitT/TauT family transport system ATP-binding protein